ncbi:hypothetical protein VNI00_004195 [Paramarasmius palmivorus]|uniref:Uncharacterized protein n=1 Tax=Paramarasmius palmivorus TaxID=297713 RepID=A0AAW0DMA8_9AGAR
MSSSDSSPSAVSTPYVDPATGDRRMLIAGLVLGFLGLIAVGIIIFWTLRLKAPQFYTLEDPEHSSSSPSDDGGVKRHISVKAGLKRKATGKLLDRNHIAAKITPFGSNVHTPGENMRIASRLPNGAWQFSEPNAGVLTSERVEQLGSPTGSTFTRRRPSQDLLAMGGSLSPGFGLAAGSSVSVDSYHTNHSNGSYVSHSSRAPLLSSEIPDSRLTLNLDSNDRDAKSSPRPSMTKKEEAAASSWMAEPEYVEMPPPAYGSSPAYDSGVGYGAGYGVGVGYGGYEHREYEREQERWGRER